MRLTTIIASVLVGVAALTSASSADERVRHYEAKPSATLEEAVKNFSEYNAKLAEILKKDKLDASDLERIHELTYTLEIALAKINKSMSGLTKTLEMLHISSEKHNEAQARGVGRVYLEVAQTVIP